MDERAGCGAHEPGADRCGRPVQPDAGLGLCEEHLSLAAAWVARTSPTADSDGTVGAGSTPFGETDLLPSPCVACGSRLGVRWPSGWLCAVCEWRYDEHPEPGAPPVRVDVVYYIRSRGRIKIGTSGNPRSRLAQLRFEELLAFERGDRMLEQHRHEQFAAHRAGREWFDEHDALLAHIDVLHGGIDPWNRYRRWVSEAAALAGRPRP